MRGFEDQELIEIKRGAVSFRLLIHLLPNVSIGVKLNIIKADCPASLLFIH